MGGSRTVQISGFPSHVSAEGVKEFIEERTGEETVYALKIRQPKVKKPKSKAFAVVQFTTKSHANGITALGQHGNLKYGIYSLKVYEVERDIVPKPRTSMFSLERTFLHFGCLISKERFYVLWDGQVVKANFGFGLRKMYFFLSCFGVSYKLELSYENIWQIQLRCPRNEAARFLLIQVQAAPRIYKRPLRTSIHVYEDPLLNYFMDTPDDQWVRTTDFTPSSSIGQSSTLCLEVPFNCDLPDIHENFVHFVEDAGQFVLENGSSYSHNLDLVPIVQPRRIELPYKIMFKINYLVQNGFLVGPTLDDEFFILVDPSSIPIAHIEHALEDLSRLKDCCFEPAKWLREQYNKYKASNRLLKSPTISLEPGLVYVHRVQVTPSKIYFYGPEVNMSNRVLRNYPEDIDNFIRVSFVDEDCDKIRSTDLVPRTGSTDDEKYTGIYTRILSTLRNGIVFGDKKFDFLAFSSSQLRDNSAWFFASRSGLNAADIRMWMGDFHEIKNVAKYAARLGQSFGSSKETLSIGRHDIEIIPDIENIENGIQYVFSDGIGKISTNLARKVARKLDIKGPTPSAFQIRYGGYKGVVAVDPTLEELKLSLRKSMCKFPSENMKLDVLAWSKYQPCFLNRQIIALLSTLGVEDRAFEMKQKEAVDQLDTILTDPVRAQEALEMMSPGENTKVLKEMLMCGYKPDAEPFLSMMLQTFRASKLLELRTRTRIFVPNGRSLMGCLDETRTLEYGQVFVQISRVGRRKSLDNGHFNFGGNESDMRTRVVEGMVIVAKNPCLHPGDVRILSAINVPALHHMVDCVVFPQKGKRPHPDECSGSDLDGDIYFVSWDTALIPPRHVDPMQYIKAPMKILDREVSVEDVEEYFTNYMVNDSLGVIANAHTAFADKEWLKAESNTCLELARLFSIAVDFNKTGVPAAIPPHLHVKEYPDFMEKLDKPTFESKGVIGKLFREIKDIGPNACSIKSFTRDVAAQSYDADMEVDGFEHYISDAYWYKSQYDNKLGNLMRHYKIKTEAEIISGCKLKTLKTYTKNWDAEAIGLAVKSLKKKVRGWFDEKGGESDFHVYDAYAKASAWYHVTYHKDYWGSYREGTDRGHFISFPWCIYDKLIHIKKEKIRLRKAAGETSTLEHRLRLNLRLS